MNNLKSFISQEENFQDTPASFENDFLEHRLENVTAVELKLFTHRRIRVLQKRLTKFRQI